MTSRTDPDGTMLETLAIAWHDRIASAYDRRYTRRRMFRERLAVWTDLIDRHVAPRAYVLDAGCGSGAIGLVAAAKGCDVLAIDGSSTMLAVAQENAHRQGGATVRFLQKRLGDPFIDTLGPFDAILCSSVLEYVREPGAALDGFSRMLRPGGVLIVSLPNRHSAYRWLERAAYRLTGRPRYLAHVATVWTPQHLETELARRNLRALETVFYGPPPGLPPSILGSAARKFSDTLFATVAVRG